MKMKSFIQTKGVTTPLIHRGLSLKSKAISCDKLVYRKVGCVISVTKPVYNHECLKSEV